MKFSIMHFCSQMSGFMDGDELWRVIERQFEGELTFNGRRVGPCPRDLPLLNYLARCQLPYCILSAQKVEIFKALSTRLFFPSHFGNVFPIKRIVTATDSFQLHFKLSRMEQLAAVHETITRGARDAAARSSSLCGIYPSPRLNWILGFN